MMTHNQAFKKCCSFVLVFLIFLYFSKGCGLFKRCVPLTLMPQTHSSHVENPSRVSHSPSTNNTSPAVHCPIPPHKWASSHGFPTARFSFLSSSLCSRDRAKAAACEITICNSLCRPSKILFYLVNELSLSLSLSFLFVQDYRDYNLAALKTKQKFKRKHI
jgi:hypothetical protein